MSATIERATTNAAPFALPVVPGNIPGQLQTRHQWVVWKWEQRDDKWTKIPVNARTGGNADSTTPNTWSTHADALKTYRTGKYAGIGYVFSADDPFTGWDFDDCRDPDTGEIAPWASAYLELLNSYAEVSPSGTGIKATIRAKHAAGARKRTGQVETYDCDRFFTVTGHALPTMPATIESRQVEHDALHAAIFPAPETLTPAHPTQPTGLGDQELLDKARTARNGAAFTALWDGDTSAYGSHSEADLALCGMLAFWTGGDTGRVDQLFRQSGLMREKWDTRRGQSSYGQDTVAKAVISCRNFYSPPGEDCILMSGGKLLWGPPGYTIPDPTEGLRTHDGASAIDEKLPPEIHPEEIPEAALAYIRRLQRDNAQLQQHVQTLRVRVSDLEERFRLERQIFARSDLDPATKLTGIAIADEMAERRRRGKVEGDTGWIPNASLAARTGLSEKRTNSHAQVLAASGYCGRDVVRMPVKNIDAETGEIFTTIRQEQHITLPAENSTVALRLLAHTRPAEPRSHGGKREAGQGNRCQHHPKADRYTLHTTYCNICHQPLASGRKELDPIPEGQAENDTTGTAINAPDLLRPAPEETADDDQDDVPPGSDTLRQIRPLRTHDDPSESVFNMRPHLDLSAPPPIPSDTSDHAANGDAQWSG